MGFNWSKYLAEGEELKMEFGVSSVYLGVLILLTFVLAIFTGTQNIWAGVLVLVMGGFYCFYLRRAKHFAVTNKKVYLVDHFLGEHVMSVEFGNITDTVIEQNFFEQVGGWGSLTLNTAGTHSPVITLGNVNRPHDIKKLIDNFTG